MFDNRAYRKQHAKKDMVSFDITVKETNLNIQAESDLSKAAVKSVLSCRNYIENYISLFVEITLVHATAYPKTAKHTAFVITILNNL
jgi:hypothetical protein